MGISYYKKENLDDNWLTEWKEGKIVLEKLSFLQSSMHQKDELMLALSCEDEILTLMAESLRGILIHISKEEYNQLRYKHEIDFKMVGELYSPSKGKYINLSFSPQFDGSIHVLLCEYPESYLSQEEVSYLGIKDVYTNLIELEKDMRRIKNEFC